MNNDYEPEASGVGCTAMVICLLVIAAIIYFLV